MIENGFALFTISKYTKRTVICTLSITIGFKRPWPKNQSHMFNITDMWQQN